MVHQITHTVRMPHKHKPFLEVHPHLHTHGPDFGRCAYWDEGLTLGNPDHVGRELVIRIIDALKRCGMRGIVVRIQ